MAAGEEVLWRECSAWLTRCGALPEDHRVNWNTTDVLDLAYTLRDGVLLCHLLNTLNPGCIDLKDISLRPQMAQFLCLKNIRTFLQTCRDVFEMKESDLFDPSMLFDYADFGKVLISLSKLSSCPRVQHLGIQGFPSSSRGLSLCDDDIYKNLEDMANEDTYAKFREDVFGDSHSGEYFYSPQDESIYDDLCSLRRSKGPAAGFQQPMEKRDYHIRELVETENNYVQALKSFKNHFVRPLAPLLGEEQRRSAFPKIKELAEIHSEFYTELLRSTKTGRGLSDVFISYKDRFTIYGEYCSKMMKAQELISDMCKRNCRFNQQVMKCQQDYKEGRWRLQDLLCVPMQRILKYHLLLKELLNATTQSHDDYNGLENAYAAMLDISEYINEVKRDNDALDLIRDIQASITDWTMPENMELKDYGHLLKDGELKIRSHDENNKLKARYIFVFDRVMLICKLSRHRASGRSILSWQSSKEGDGMLDIDISEGEQYSFKDSLYLGDYQIEEATNRRETGWKYGWHLVHKDKSNVYTLYTKTQDAKAKWIHAIQDALSRLCPEEAANTDHDYALNTFTQPTSCADCRKLLKGVFFQGYSCSRCGLAVHKKCIAAAPIRRCGLRRPLINMDIPPPTPERPSHMDIKAEVQLPNQLNSVLGEACRVVVLTTFVPSTDGYLKLNVGDVIMVTHKINATLWKGIGPEGKEGLFSAAFVKEIENPASPTSLLSPSPQNYESSVSGEGYVNLDLGQYSWFVGTMDRDEAVQKLDKAPPGTFLVRYSMKQEGFVISLNFNNEVRHMKVCKEAERFFLSVQRYFRTVVELVQWYEEHSLKESFKMLDTVLERSWKALQWAVVQHSYNATASNNASGATLLSLEQGDIVAILSKTEDARGWWKGQTGSKVGFFPKEFVNEVSGDEMCVLVSQKL